MNTAVLIIVVIVVLILALYAVSLLPFGSPPLKNLLQILVVVVAILVILRIAGLL